VARVRVSRGLIHRSAWRNCLENTPEGTLPCVLVAEVPGSGLICFYLTALGVSIRRQSRFSRQFRNRNSRKFAVSSSRPVPLIKTPRAVHGYLLGPEESMVVIHEARIRYKRSRLATLGDFLCTEPRSSVHKKPIITSSKYYIPLSAWPIGPGL
jgi:hypothetical protein